MGQDWRVNHFLVYPIEPVKKEKRVELQDQFDLHTKPKRTTRHRLKSIDLVANPAIKIWRDEPKQSKKPKPDMHLHYTWWPLPAEVKIDHLDAVLHKAPVLVSHQFVKRGGHQEWRLTRWAYLVMPALKNPDKQEKLPRANHYKAYKVARETANKFRLSINIRIADQWNPEPESQEWPKVTLTPRFLLVPTSKLVIGRNVKQTEPFPRIAEQLHLACFEINRGLPLKGGVGAFRDQFHDFKCKTKYPKYLCVPAGKLLPK